MNDIVIQLLKVTVSHWRVDRIIHSATFSSQHKQLSETVSSHTPHSREPLCGIISAEYYFIDVLRVIYFLRKS